MKRSKSDTAETRKRIVSMASKLFLEQGLAETGIADIMSAAGLTQGGFYRHFDSKEQLIAEAHIAASEMMIQHCELAIVGMSPRDALNTVVSLYLHQSLSESPAWLCPLPHLGSELRNSNNKVRSVAMNAYTRAVDFVAAFTKELGIPDHAAVADAIFATMVGAVMLSRLAGKQGVARTILDSAQQAVNALISEESPA